jgi:hypothetical protein
VAATYNKLEDSVEIQGQKNINQAYNNYIQNEMLLKHQGNIAQGYKQQYLEALNRDTANTVGAYKSQLELDKAELASKELTELSALSSDIASEKAAAEKSINDQSSRLAKYNQYALQMMFENMYDSVNNPEDGTYNKSDLNTLFEYDSKGKMTGVTDKFEALYYNPDGSLTDAGAQLYANLMNDLDGYLTAKATTQEVSDWIDKDKEWFRTAMTTKSNGKLAEYDGISKQGSTKAQVQQTRADVYNSGKDTYVYEMIGELPNMDEYNDE